MDILRDRSVEMFRRIHPLCRAVPVVNTVNIILFRLTFCGTDQWKCSVASRSRPTSPSTSSKKQRRRSASSAASSVRPLMLSRYPVHLTKNLFSYWFWWGGFFGQMSDIRTVFSKMLRSVCQMYECFRSIWRRSTMWSHCSTRLTTCTGIMCARYEDQYGTGMYYLYFVSRDFRPLVFSSNSTPGSTDSWAKAVSNIDSYSRR
jgi:hypothetical protein